MDSSMTSVPRTLTLRLKIAFARWEQRVGWPGLLGVALLIAGVILVTVGRPDPLAPQSLGVPRALRGQPAVAAIPDVPTLPPVADVPLLLTRIQRAALDQGLGWPRADYRLNAATDDTPASLDVRCVLKGPYPQVRRFVTTLLQDLPTLTLREFSLSRPNSEVAEVEAKLSLVVYLGAQSPSSSLVQASTAAAPEAAK